MKKLPLISNSLHGSECPTVLGAVVFVLAAFASSTASAQPPSDAAPPAFPGAEGFGAYTVGGRGGQVLIVTSLEDYDLDERPIPGTLREAVETSGSRTIVFEVSGYIELKRPLEVTEPNLTIAAQTAPGEGVSLKNYGVQIGAPQVVIRHLRVRPGDVAGVEQDAVNIIAPDVIVDHCSASWGTDEVVSVIGRADRVTIQWCLISESLNSSVHHKGMHGYGTLLTNTGGVSIHHSAYVLHYSRNPRPKDLTLDFRNNLIYGFGDQAGYNYEDHTRMNYVGNVIQPLGFSKDPACAFNLGGLNSRFFVYDNLLIEGGDTRKGDWQFVCTPDSVSRKDVDAVVRLGDPVETPPVTTESPDGLRAAILQNVGATRPGRDAVDRRVLATVDRGEGAIVDSQDDVGGWLPLDGGEARPDLDRDGMADGWESAHGLDPGDPGDHALDADGDGYTNLEEYLNETDPNDH